MGNSVLHDGAVNDPVHEAIEQLDLSLKHLSPVVTEAVTFQAISQVAVMMLQNMVVQQQMDHTLRNAFTTAAAVATLNGRRAEAEAVLALAEARLGHAPNLADEIVKLGQVLSEVAVKFDGLPKLAGTAAI